jgi:hypothetical protein
MGTTAFSPDAGRYLLYAVFTWIERGHAARETRSTASAKRSRSNRGLKNGSASRRAHLLLYKKTSK